MMISNGKNLFGLQGFYKKNQRFKGNLETRKYGKEISIKNDRLAKCFD